MGMEHACFGRWNIGEEEQQGGKGPKTARQTLIVVCVLRALPSGASRVRTGGGVRCSKEEGYH